MYALRLHEISGPEGIVYEQAPPPSPGIGDVLVRVHAASFTPTELSWPSTWVDRRGHDRRPVIPGHEVSGVIEALGYGTSGLDVGQAVYGLTDWYRDGAAAELVAVEARNLALKPASVSHAEAAGCALAGLTAWQGLFDHAQLQRGQTVLIQGAAGGVGSLAVQLAHAAGARVIGTGHGAAHEWVGALGADQFIDVTVERFEEAVRSVDVVLDLVGGEVLNRSPMVLKPGGVLVSAVALPDPGAMRDDVRCQFFVVEPNRPQLGELADRLASGELQPILGAKMALSDGRAAFQTKQQGGTRGKTVLEVAA
jgi:NADPH:quinone reductase-like Zn-dependent oxidoreductase